MSLNEWNTFFIGESIINEVDRHLEVTNLVVLMYDEATKFGISINKGSRVLLTGPDSDVLKEFELESVALKTNQAINLSNLELLGPFFVLECEISSVEDIWAISSLFSGLLELAGAGVENAIFYEAINALENYFIQTRQRGNAGSVEVGLYSCTYRMCLVPMLLLGSSIRSTVLTIAVRIWSKETTTSQKCTLPWATMSVG